VPADLLLLDFCHLLDELLLVRLEIFGVLGSDLFHSIRRPHSDDGVIAQHTVKYHFEQRGIV